MVELLVAVSLVGILSGVLISIINPVKQRKIAEDGVKLSNLNKFAMGIESYSNANSEYPAEIKFDAGIPVYPEDLVNFLSRKPDGEPYGAVYEYYYDPPDDAFSVVTLSSEDQTLCFKYRSTWGKIKTCSVKYCDGSVECL